jgi:diaminopimelate decarboxylase
MTMGGSLRHVLPDTWAVQGGRASVGGIALGDIAAEHGTPLYVVDITHVRNRMSEYRSAFADDVVLAYAAKAFICPAFAALIEAEGWWVDVVSLGEAMTARTGGVPAERLIFHGNNKSAEELRYAAENGVGRLVLDHLEEVDACAAAAGEAGTEQRVLIRLDLEVDAATHPKVRTSGRESHFGMSPALAAGALRRVAAYEQLELAGVHGHIGSQIGDLACFRAVVEQLVAFVAEFRDDFPAVVEIDVGGGLAAPYLRGDRVASIADYGAAITESVAESAARSGVDTYRLITEPGRSIVANAGITLYRIGVRKQDGGNPILAVDGGMSDNPRPVIYGSEYELVLPERIDEPADTLFRVVGRHCEAGDVVAASAPLPANTGAGDLLAVLATGAYTFAMSSRYNMAPRAAVVFVDEGSAQVVVPAEDLTAVVGGLVAGPN